MRKANLKHNEQGQPQGGGQQSAPQDGDVIDGEVKE